MDRLADLALVAVSGRGVDVAVSDVKCGADGVPGLVGRGLEDAEAEGGHLDAVVQFQAGRGVIISSSYWGLGSVFTAPARSGGRGSR